MVIILLAFLSGVLGRMGGAKGYSTYYRDLGCPALLVMALTLVLGWHPWIYLSVFLLTWGAMSTYWQFLFKGEDNLWMSGAMVGVALYPIVFIDNNLFVFILARTICLAVIWGCLNKFLPQKGVLLWRRDVVEEFSRYAVSL